MAIKLDGVVETLVPLGILGAVGYFAVVYGPGLMDSVNTIIQNGLTGGAGSAPAVSGVSACAGITDPTQLQQCCGSQGITDPIALQQCMTPTVSGSSAACAGITNPQQLQLCQYMQQMQNPFGAQNPFGGGAQNPFGQYGAGGLGALNPGLPSPFGSAIQNTGGLPYQGIMAPKPGTPTCTNGVCRTFVGETLNGW